ncbi:MAG: MaoC family dehydratase [Proteobacteria bacterium]|nr:MaoC family dehydratase [Pseudomonadota bacterium]
MRVMCLEDLSAGQSAETVRTVTAQDIDRFAEVSGDFNPVHVDEAYASTTPFKSRIAHGMLAAGFISAVLGSKLPGPGAIYVSQTLNFKRAIRIGDEVLVRVEVTAIDEKKAIVTLKTVCSVGRKAMVDGEAVVSVQRRAELEAERA